MTNQNYADRAAKALCNLNTYGALIALCENSLFLDGRDRLSSRIVRMCQAEQQKELAIYDAAMASIK